MQFSGSVLTPAEAELLVRQIKTFPMNEIGSEAWKEQRIVIEQLNMCTHSNAVHKVDDYVRTFLIEHNHLTDILHELLAMEVWRQRVLPLVTEAVASNATAAYMYCYYESVLVNFLECICFYEDAVIGFGDDILELIDYCWRQLYCLFSERDLSRVRPPSTVAALQRESPLEQLECQVEEARITKAMSCLSILWFVIDRLDQLPLAANNAVLQKNDLPVGLCEVLLLQPWMRRSATATQKYINGSFAEVKGDEALRVCVPEAHTWFCLHKLLCDPECRKRYPYTQSKKEIILRIRRFLNDALLDQIPALSQVQRALEELSFMEPPSGTEEKFRSALIIEPVPRLMASLDNDRQGWELQAARMERLLRDPSEKIKDAARMSRIFDQMFPE